MKKRQLFVFMILSYVVGMAQQNPISLETIWDGSLRPQWMQALKSMKNGKQYSVLEFDKATQTTSVDVYDYASLEKTQTVVSGKDLDGINTFSSYSFNTQETKVLLATNTTKIYRHSFLATYYVYDIATKKLSLVADGQIQEPTFSPLGDKIAYMQNNNLFVKDLKTNTTTQFTFDGKKNHIINGIADWVYEEEFAFVRAFDWNADGTKIAFTKFDESEVPEFSMDVYGKALYPKQAVFKYPKAGEKNAELSLHVYDLVADNLQDIALQGYYIPRIKFTKDPDILSVQTLNRHQNDLKLHFVDVVANKSNIVLEEKDAAYIDITDNLTFLNNNSFLWTSEKDGFNHIYHYSKTGKLKRQLTHGNWEVTNFYGFSPNTARVYYQSTETGSINRAVYSIGLNGKGKKALATTLGTNSASFSSDFTYFINRYSDALTPYAFSLHKGASGEKIKTIIDNQPLQQKIAAYSFSTKEFFTITTDKGHTLNAWMVKPKDFDATKKYPMLMYQYSGPGSQQVANRWNSANDYWYQLLAQKGYIVVCVDGRGTGFKGAAFKKATYLNLVGLETEDQIAAAKQLASRSYIDPDRVGIWGWSFGGHMSTNCLLKGADVFSMAIAVAPVTSWRFYDTIYTERFMRTPQENPQGYDNNSPFNYPELLKGKYLLIHGSADDNVHVQHTMRMVEALIQANKRFDWAIYPDKDHGIYGGNTRLHLYTKMTDFIEKNL